MQLGSIAAITGLMLNPFGSAPDYLQAGKPWFAFDAQGPVLHLVRIQKTPVKSCKAWTHALVEANDLVSVHGPDSIQKAWEPWGEKDLDAIQECDDFPCKVKLDAAEVEAIKKMPKTGRLAKFDSLINARIEAYEKTGMRKGCEFPGQPIDPWIVLETKGYKPSIARPEKPELFARKLNFEPDKMLTMHQILDRRAAENPQGNEAVVWIRDVYTDHYFDSWGEWSLVNCDDAQKEAMVIQTLLSEMDLLKRTSFLAHALFGRYRSAFEDNGKVYLDAEFERLKKAAEKIESQVRAQPGK